MTTGIYIRPTQQFQELDYREGDGLEVSLLWNPHDNTLSVYVFDSRTDRCFDIPAPPDRAQDVFLHPYAYALAEPNRPDAH